MVVSAHPEASKIGIKILQLGGNAFDATVATEFALAVCFPIAGNIGGGGLLVFRQKNGEIGTLDYREKAPALAHKNMYLDEKGEIIKDKSQDGALAVGVPGTVAGMYALHQQFGKLEWKKIVQPAIDLAKNGLIVTEKEANKFNENQDAFKKFNIHISAFINDKKWKKGDILIQPALAFTLEKIRDNGKKGFYEGEIAALIVEEMKKQKGIITFDDLKNYTPTFRRPLLSKYRGKTIITMPPPSAGGLLLTQMLQMLQPFDLKNLGFQSEKYIQLLTEVERRAYADRAKYLGDSDFFPVPIDQLLHPKYIRERMKSFSFEKATPSKDIQEGKLLPISEETTHYCVIDEDGNAISATTTLNGAYGSKVVVTGAGFFLNNEMDDFSGKPNAPNLYGLIGSEANSIAPNKKMLSSMTPVIVEEKGKISFLVGTPGGSTITTSVLQTIINVIDFEMNMADAVASPRFHHQYLPDEIQYEETNLNFTEKLVKNLEKKGYFLKKRIPIGRVQGIKIMPDGRYEGGADTRGDDTAIGF
ncbi:MAG: gamma-glutamyltransferase [Bacteroidetes bacterium]|nr:MAG: gamma-glutamyltransferase [Bacteroidota bacterium]TAG86528.1 MAG: gamma-glutamyltransferase [Bacteroidota bacterium]